MQDERDEAAEPQDSGQNAQDEETPEGPGVDAAPDEPDDTVEAPAPEHVALSEFSAEDEGGEEPDSDDTCDDAGSSADE